MSSSNTSSASDISQRDPLAFLGFTSEEVQILQDATEDVKDEFRMHIFKIEPCEKRYSHDWTTCPFAHPGEKAKRRDPRTSKYAAIACIDMKNSGICPRGDDCPYAHNVFEYWMHPTRYRTQICNDGTKCKRKICFFAHRLEELRRPPHKPGFPPEWNRSRKHGKSKRSTSSSSSSPKTEKSFNSPLPLTPKKEAVPQSRKPRDEILNIDYTSEKIFGSNTMSSNISLGSGLCSLPLKLENNNSFKCAEHQNHLHIHNNNNNKYHHHHLEECDNIGVFLPTQKQKQQECLNLAHEMNYNDTVQQLLASPSTLEQLQVLNMAAGMNGLLGVSDIHMHPNFPICQPQELYDQLKGLALTESMSMGQQGIHNATSQFMDFTGRSMRDNRGYGISCHSVDRLSDPQAVRFPMDYTQFPALNMPEMSSPLSPAVADMLHFNCCAADLLSEKSSRDAERSLIGNRTDRLIAMAKDYNFNWMAL